MRIDDFRLIEGGVVGTGTEFPPVFSLIQPLFKRLLPLAEMLHDCGVARHVYTDFCNDKPPVFRLDTPASDIITYGERLDYFGASWVLSDQFRTFSAGEYESGIEARLNATANLTVYVLSEWYARFFHFSQAIGGNAVGQCPVRAFDCIGRELGSVTPYESENVGIRLIQ